MAETNFGTATTKIRRDEHVATEFGKSIVYYDGSCPLCRTEIGYYRRLDQADGICFVDVADSAAAPPAGVTRKQALQRFHVRAGDGRMLSGAAAFVEVWSHLPGWRWAARAARLPGMLAMLELGYRAFLPLRPRLARLFGAILRSNVSGAGAGRP